MCTLPDLPALLLLACSEWLGEAFTHVCVSKLRGVYLELLDAAEATSKEGVPTFSSPAFQRERGLEGSATPSKPIGVKQEDKIAIKPEENKSEEKASSPSTTRPGGAAEVAPVLPRAEESQDKEEEEEEIEVAPSSDEIIAQKVRKARRKPEPESEKEKEVEERG